MLSLICETQFHYFGFSVEILHRDFEELIICWNNNWDFWNEDSLSKLLL